MIETANIFVSPAPAKPVTSAAVPASRTADSKPSRESSRDTLLPDRKVRDAVDDPNRSEEPRENPPNAACKPQTDEPTTSREETKSETPQKDVVDFQQIIGAALSELAGETPSETTGGGIVPTDNREMTQTLISPVITEAVVQNGSLATTPESNPAVSTKSSEIPTPVLTQPTPTAETPVVETPLPATPQAIITSPEAVATPETIDVVPGRNEQPSVPQNTSGRPESTPLTANVPQAEIPRTNVEATDSSTVVETAAPEINPHSGDSGAMTQGRPVVPLPTTDSPKSDAPVSKDETTISFDASGQKQTDAQAFSGGSSGQSSTNDSFAGAQARVMASPSTEPASQADSTKLLDTQADLPADSKVSQNVAVITESSNAAPNPTQVEPLTESWTDIEQPTVSAAGNNVAAAATPRGVGLTEQITAHIQMRRDDLGEEMVIRLDPPELGKVRIQIRSENGQLAGVIRTDNAQTHAELQREASSLMQRLNEAGVRIKTLDMQMNDMSQQGRGEQSFAQAQNAYSMFQQHNGGGRGYGENYAGSDDTRNLIQDDLETYNDQAGQYVSDSALNVML
jgi:flagellar hook-length control protein FliK